MLTNFLPSNGGSTGLGNGSFVLHALAHNATGNSVDLGTSTITVDNAHATKPFGTIDTPGQGATASGNGYVNFGWALTQNPYNIPTDGSTLSVILDELETLKQSTYNHYRSDIANLLSRSWQTATERRLLLSRYDCAGQRGAQQFLLGGVQTIRVATDWDRKPLFLGAEQWSYRRVY